MKRVHLHFAPDDVHPVYRLLTTSPHVERATGLHWNVSESGTLTTLLRVVGDVDGIERRLEEIDPVREFEVLRVGRDDEGDEVTGRGSVEDEDDRGCEREGPLERDGVNEAYVYICDDGTDDSRLLFRALSADGVLTVGPIEYDETGSSFTVVGEDEALQRAHESVPDRFDVEIERVGAPTSAIDPTGELSDRQREAARVGVDLGYFDVPRQANHEDVARALGCSPSTAAEHLQKAQSKLVRAAFDVQPRGR